MTLLLAACIAMKLPATHSAYHVRLHDDKAVYLDTSEFGAKADGVADDTAALQAAIDKTGQGVMFVPSGTYRLTKTLVVGPGTRLIGFGPTRPVFLLAENTPGYADGERFMVFFSGGRGRGNQPLADVPAAPKGKEGLDFDLPNEANPGTFYSALSNIDFEIKAGNRGAVAIRGRFAQHCYIAHSEFRLGDALAGLHDTGNLGDDLRFVGGQYGIITRTPSPGWQYTLMDSSFEGQSKAAIRCHEVGLTLVRPSFRNVPTAIAVEPDHTEQLWMQDARLEDVGTAISFGRENSMRLQLNAERTTCVRVPVFANLQESKRQLKAPGDTYLVETFSHGQHYAQLGDTGVVKTIFDAHPTKAKPAPPVSDVQPLPPAETWVNVKSLGAVGDGETDDTAALRAAIAKHRAIYLPSGKYRVTDTIALKHDTVLIGLNPITTQILIKDGTPAFAGVPEPAPTIDSRFYRPDPKFPGAPVPLVSTPKGGASVITGIGLDTGGNNPAAVAALWKAGERSLLDDVKFLGGHGSNAGNIYDLTHSADPNPERKWDSQYPSLWVLDGGGGTFKNIWTASTFAAAGMLVSDTSTPGRVYQMSTEHHVRNEVVLRRAHNWSLIALQAEEERGESQVCLPLDIQECSNVLVANLNVYRVISMFHPGHTAVRVGASRDVRIRGAHCNSNSKVSFDNLLVDAATGYELRQREFSWLDFTGAPPAPHQQPDITKLCGGFYNISGGATAPNGDVYFVDAKWHRIYRWSPGAGLSVVDENPLTPVNLFTDQAGNLLVVAYNGKGTVYTLGPDGPRLIKAEPAKARTGTPVLAVTDWELDRTLVGGGRSVRPYHYVSPDGTTFLPAPQGFVDGSTSWGIKDSDVIRSFGLAKWKPGQPVYFSGENNSRTYAADLAPDGTLGNARLFAEQGGEALAVGPDGNVYIGAGEIYVYNPGGKLVKTIHPPERPTQLLFSNDGKTLYICARSSLYSLRP